jgi:hypothetical protein
MDNGPPTGKIISQVENMKNSLKILALISSLFVFQYCVADDFYLPASAPPPFSPVQKQVPLLGQPSGIPVDFDKNSVFFLFQKNGAHYEPRGTGFTVDVTSLHYAHEFLYNPLFAHVLSYHPYYFVTAKHVLFDRSGKFFPDMYMRFNNNTNGISYVPLTSQITNGAYRVLFSTNAAVDMAIVTWGFSSANTNAPFPDFPNNVNLVGLDSSLLLTPEKFSQFEIREGYDMFFIGLFVQFYGSYRNFPICRFGHLAMLPDEPISIEGMPPQKLFFMESAVYEGNSGSPAFFRTERSIPILKTFDLLSSKSGEHDKIILAGIVEGTYFFPTELNVSNTLAMTPILEHAGVGAVVPATYINEVLFSKEEINNRKLLLKRLEPHGYF